MSMLQKHQKLDTELLTTFPTKQKRISLSLHPVHSWLCYCTDQTLTLFDYASKCKIATHQLSYAGPVLQVLFFDCSELCSTMKTETEMSLREQPTLILVVQDHAITCLNYYSFSENTIKATSDTKGFSCAAIFDESRFLIGCVSGSILLWDTTHWACAKAADKSLHNNRPIIAVIKSKADQRVVSVSDNGKICVWDILQNVEDSFKLIQEITENVSVHSSDISGNGVVGMYAANKLVLWDTSTMKKQAIDKILAIDKLKLFSNHAIGVGPGGIAFIKLADEHKNAVQNIVESKEMDPSFTKIISLGVNRSNPHIIFVASPEKVAKLDVSALFLPKIITHPDYTTGLSLAQIRSGISERGIITKLGGEIAPSIPSEDANRFFYNISGKDLCCVTYTVDSGPHGILNVNKVVSKVAGAIPDTISPYNSIIPTVNGNHFGIRCEVSGNTGVWTIQPTPLFSLQKVFIGHTLSIAWSHKTALCAMLQYVGKTSNICIQTYIYGKGTEFTPLANIRVSDIKALFSGYYLGVANGSKCSFYSWSKLIPTGLSIDQPLNLVWENENVVLAVYSNEIVAYEIYEKDLCVLYRIHCEESIVGAFKAGRMLYYYTNDKLYAYIEDVSILLGAKGCTETVYDMIKFPENSVSYKHLSHCYVSSL